jgi:hypothetical protein
MFLLWGTVPLGEMDFLSNILRHSPTGAASLFPFGILFAHTAMIIAQKWTKIKASLTGGVSACWCFQAP